MRKGWLLGLALLLLLAANLHPVYRVTVDGRTLPGRYTRAQTEDCVLAAREVAEEILENSAPTPALGCSLRLSLRPADGDTAALTDALLRSVKGVSVSDQVIVNGVSLGTVADGETLCRELEAWIDGQMPTKAVSGGISGRLELRPVYTRPELNTPYPEMVLLVTGTAPVFYVDAEGKLA